MWFEPSIKVFHVELRTPERQAKSTYPYSVGAGYLLRLHHCGLARLLAVVEQVIGRRRISACRGANSSCIDLSAARPRHLYRILWFVAWPSTSY